MMETTVKTMKREGKPLPRYIPNRETRREAAKRLPRALRLRYFGKPQDMGNLHRHKRLRNDAHYSPLRVRMEEWGKEIEQTRGAGRCRL